MIETTQEAVTYVIDYWQETHASMAPTYGVRPPACCALTRLALVEIALEHELGVPGFGAMNHAEATVLMIDLLRRGMEQLGGEAATALLVDLGLEGPGAEAGH